MVKEQTSVYWHGSRVGHYVLDRHDFIAIGMGMPIKALVTAIEIPREVSLAQLANADNIIFDPSFAELRGLIGVRVESEQDE